MPGGTCGCWRSQDALGSGFLDSVLEDEGHRMLWEGAGGFQGSVLVDAEGHSTL